MMCGGLVFVSHSAGMEKAGVAAVAFGAASSSAPRHSVSSVSAHEA